MATFQTTEFPDLDALRKLIHYYKDLPLTDKQRKPIQIGDKSFELLSLLKKYEKEYNPKFCGMPISYGHSKNNPDFPGRQFARGPSLQGMRRCIRHTLSKAKYHDYDMVNCHPTIFVQYCKKKGWDTSPFDSYLEKRDEYLKELMESNGLDRDDAKAVVLSILNGGTRDYNALDVKPVWLKVYKASVEEIQTKILNDPENKKLVDHVKTYKKRNVGGAAMNLLLCRIENKILMEAIKYLVVKFPSLAFDGFQCIDTFTQDKLDEMSQAVFELLDYKMKWTEKQMDEAIDLSSFPEVPEENGIEGDLNVFSEVMKKFPDYIKRKGTLIFIFDERTGMWSSDKEAHGIWMNMCEEIECGYSYKAMMSAFALTQKLDDSTAFFEKATKARLGKLLYANCIRDIENRKSLPFSSDYFFTLRIDRNFNEVPNEEDIQKVFHHLYVEPHENPEVRNELWKTLSMGLTGRNVQRGFTMNIAPTRCGKSTCINTHVNSHAPYVKSISSQTFIVSRFAKANDHNDNLLLLRDTRLLFSSEKPGGGEIDEELIKNATGGDGISARACGQKASESFVSESHLVFMGNSPLQFNNKGSALQERVKAFRWRVQFPVTGDKSVELFLKSDEAKEAMDHIIERGIELYQKEGFVQVKEIVDFTNELNDEDDKFLTAMENHFDLDVGNSDDQDTWILSSSVYRLFKDITEYEVKSRFKDLGVVFGRFRKKGDVNQKSYFKGLVKKQLQTVSDY